MSEDLAGKAVQLSAFDVKFADPASAPVANARRLELSITRSAAEAAADADLIISAVTAAQTIDAAKSVGHIKPGALFLDLNSASPNGKMQACLAIDQAARAVRELS